MTLPGASVGGRRPGCTQPIAAVFGESRSWWVLAVRKWQFASFVKPSPSAARAEGCGSPGQGEQDVPRI